jgi:hypothetical protein
MVPAFVIVLYPTVPYSMGGPLVFALRMIVEVIGPLPLKGFKVGQMVLINMFIPLPPLPFVISVLMITMALVRKPLPIPLPN